jgi:azurin
MAKSSIEYIGAVVALAGGVALAGLLQGPATVAHAQAPKGTGPVRTVTITANDDMKFSLTEIKAAPGETLKIRLVSIGTQPRATMAHNVVVLQAGTNQLVFADAAAKAVATDYIPDAFKAQILASTPLIANGQTADLTLTLPRTAGNYPFLCTFPGHFAAGARGKIVVQ